jgi:hypothetical protein
MGAFVEGEFPFAAMQFFQAPLFVFLLLFFMFISCFKELDGGHYPSLVSKYDSVIHKYLAEMRRLARVETPFSSVMQMRATTLAW